MLPLPTSLESTSADQPLCAQKRIRLADPVVTAGDRVYCICSQNGLFPDPWSGHVPHEAWGVWNHPIKLPLLAARADLPPMEDQHWLLRHWVIACPLEAGLATPDQAQRALTRLESSEFSGEWGMFLHPTRQSVMTINTGVLAMAEAHYGRVDQAHRLVRKLVDALPYHMPGAISEALPDQWCFLQLWSALGLVSPVVAHFLGIAPAAGRRRLHVTPNLPPAWNHADLCQLRVGEDVFDVAVQWGEGTRRVQVNGPEEYALTVGCSVPGGGASCGRNHQRCAGPVALGADCRRQLCRLRCAQARRTGGAASVRSCAAPPTRRSPRRWFRWACWWCPQR